VDTAQTLLASRHEFNPLFIAWLNNAVNNKHWRLFLRTNSMSGGTG
jgi:hypothetical protein